MKDIPGYEEQYAITSCGRVWSYKSKNFLSPKRDKDGYYFVGLSKNGIVKKTPVEDYTHVRKTGLNAITLREGDELIEVKATDNTKDILMVTKKGMCIRFNESDVRCTGRTSQGVIGMNLSDQDEIIGMQLDHQGDSLLIV